MFKAGGEYQGQARVSTKAYSTPFRDVNRSEIAQCHSLGGLSDHSSIVRNQKVSVRYL